MLSWVAPLLTDHDLGCVTCLGQWRVNGGDAGRVQTRSSSALVRSGSDGSRPLHKTITYPQVRLFGWVPEQEDIEQFPSQSIAWRRATRLPADDM